MTISINQIKMGIGLRIGGDIFLVTSYDHVKPGKGTAFVRLKLKNVKSQQVLEKTFKTADKLEDVDLTRKPLQSLYRSGDIYHFMDLESYEEKEIDIDLLGDSVLKFLKDDMEVTGVCLDEEILKVELPIFIEEEITHTEPGFKGDSSKAGTKPSQISNGTGVLVPLFVDIGDFIKIDTRTGTYVERIKK